MTGGMPGGDESGGGSGSAGDEQGAEGSATTGEGGAYGTVGSVGERDPGPGGMTDVAGGSGGQGSLEDEFEKSLGDFDDSLLEEQQKVAEVSRDTGAFESGGGRSGGGSVGLGEQAGEDGEGSGGTVGVVNNSAGGAGGSMRQEPGSVDQLSKEQIGERTPEDIPSGVDDDIVAKQLREAALAEEDPELRERLWDEYRAYKGL